MKTVACYKWIMNEDCISVSSHDRSIQFKNPVYEVNPYDRNAIEAAVQCAEKTDGECVVLSAGEEIVSKSKKDVLSCGPKEAFIVIDPKMEKADCTVTANVLAAAIQKIGDVDLVFCSEASADTFAQQMGPRVAQQLGWPVVTYVTSIELGEGCVIVERETENSIEKLEVPLPAVIAVAGDSNTPRMPKLKDVMSAGKKPMTQWSISDLGLGEEKVTAEIETISTIGNSTDRKTIVIEGLPAEEAMDKLLKYLIDEGVVS